MSVSDRSQPELPQFGLLWLEKKTLRSFETSGTTHPTTRRHIPEDLSFRQHRCENLSSGSCLIQTNLVNLKSLFSQSRVWCDPQINSIQIFKKTLTSKVYDRKRGCRINF